MNNKVASGIAALMAVFFLFATLDQAAAGLEFGAIVGLIFFVVLAAIAMFTANLNDDMVHGWIDGDAVGGDEVARELESRAKSWMAHG